MTASEQQKLDAALATYNSFLTKEQTALSNFYAWRTKALNCQALRDQYSFGPKKNDACHIDDLNEYKLQWGLAETALSSAQAQTKVAKAAYDTIKAEVFASSSQSLATNPDVVIAQGQSEIELQKIETENAAAKIENEAKRKSQQKIVIFVIVGVVVIVLGIVLFKKFS